MNRSFLTRSEFAPIRRQALFGASLYLLTKAHRLVVGYGVKAAQAALLKPWTAAADSFAETPARVLDEIDAAIDLACQWLPTEMTCLPRSIGAYALARAMGARPVHHMGVRARPYYGHAWTCVGARVIGDSLGSVERDALRVVKRFPPPSGGAAAAVRA
jgi:hypothetical protein